MKHDQAARPHPSTALVYNGHVIRDRHEMLSLTDMWKAAGSNPSRTPAEWRRQPATEAFIECVAGSLEMGNTHFQTFKGGRGIGGSTFAHWQIGLAYAKYLSPEFHMWCNEVVRAHMQGTTAPARPSIVGEEADLIRRIDGISRMLSHKVTEIEKALPALVSQHLEAAILADPRRAIGEYVSVRQILDEAKVPSRRRNKLNRRLGYRLRMSALTDESRPSVRRCPHSSVWLFPRDFATRFMRAQGAAMVRDHLAQISGQGVLRLVPGGAE